MSRVPPPQRTVLALPLVIAAVLLTHPPKAAANNTDRDAGAKVFREAGCEHCHGVNGVGGEEGPPIANIGKRWTRTAIEHQIKQGGGAMPEFGDVLSDGELRQLLAFLRAPKK